MTTATTVRTLGVEEEFLLLDRATWRPAPVAPRVLADYADAGSAGAVRPELTLERVGTATPVLRDLDDLRGTLVALRRRVAAVAERHGAALVASGTSPFPPRQQLTCGCSVHVAVESPEEAVGAMDRMRPWLPVLVAI